MSVGSVQYNARQSRPEAIAASFVRHPEFGAISEHRSKVLIGPRGVGKTTILKLLTSSGVYHLRKRKDFLDFKIDYLPLYIPADTLWKGEASSIASAVGRKRNGLTDETGRILQNALFVDYCFYEVISSLQDAISVGRKIPEGAEVPPWAIKMERSVEGEICRHLASAWGLERSPRSFLGLKMSLNDRQNHNSSFISGLRNADSLELKRSESLDFFVKIRPLFDIMEEYAAVQAWGIHFDEMEIAPKEILDRVFQSLRSFDQRAVLKFSLFPYADFLDLSGLESLRRSSPQEGADYDAVVLSGRFKYEDYSFARELVESICSARDVSLQEIIEYTNSAVTTKAVRFLPNGTPQRQYNELFKSLAAKDDSFHAYLKARKLDPNKMKDMNNVQQAERVRKIAPLVEFRNVHLRSFRLTDDVEFPVAFRQTRKSYTYYFGFERLLRLTEQNPRAVNFYFDPLISAFKMRRPVRPIMNETIRINTDRFRALYATQVVPYDPLQGKMMNILDFVDSLGSEIAHRLLDRPFSERPVLTFEATSKLDDHLKKLLGIAVNAGALVADVEGGQNSLLTGLADLRFRVSYQLSPFYPSPTIAGESRRFSSISPVIDKQPDLLSWASDDV